MTSTECQDSNGQDFIVIAQRGESIAVSKDEFEDMKDIPRKFNETLTDWAIRCQVLRRYRAPMQETGSSSHTTTT